MDRYTHRRLLLVMTVTLLGGMASGCSHDKQEALSAAAAARAPSPSPSPFAMHSRRIIEQVEPRRTTTPNAAGTPEEEAYDPVSITIEADPTSGGAPLAVDFRAAVEGGPPGLTYRWTFGDHSPMASRRNVQHTYTAAGEYTATFTVSGPDVNESDTVDIEVTEEGFDLDIEADPDVGSAPLTVNLAGIVDEEVPAPVLLQWDFGDGARATGSPTSHTYRFPGQYTVTLTATNATGQTATYSVEIQVDSPDDSD